jgi:hypothetical protein
MIEKVRLWGGSAFGVGGTRKRSLRVPSPVARLREEAVNPKSVIPLKVRTVGATKTSTILTTEL